MAKRESVWKIGQGFTVEGRVAWRGPSADDGGGFVVGNESPLDWLQPFEGQRVLITIEVIDG